MFWGKSVNEINGKGGVCPPLCRDPLRRDFQQTFSAHA
jgi:hypothetical protein